MSARNIQAVLFDADGVTQLTGDFSRYMEEQYGWSEEKYDEFFHVLFRKDGYKEALKGNIDFIPVLADILAEFGGGIDAEDFMHQWLHRNIVIDIDLWEHIGKLRSNGTKCYLASNQERHRAKYMRNDLGYSHHFDGLYFSCEIGELKPTTAYFRTIIEKIGLPPDDMLFFDDYEDSVEKAKSLGIYAKVYENFTNYLTILREYGLTN